MMDDGWPYPYMGLDHRESQNRPSVPLLLDLVGRRERDALIYIIYIGMVDV